MSGAQCCENPPALTPSSGSGSGSGSGSVIKLSGLSAYASGSRDSTRALILISDVFGYEAPNLRKLADKAAAAGYYVVVPDFLNGDPFDPKNTDKPLLEWIKLHSPEKSVDDAKSVIATLRSQGVTAVGAAGFCWGAKLVVQLGKADHIQAAVLLHPSLCTIDDIKDLKSPIAILGAETDHISPPVLLKQFEEILSSKPEVDGYVKIFPGVVHGWTVRYSVEDENAVKAAEEAHRDMLDWFSKCLK